MFGTRGFDRGRPARAREDRMNRYRGSYLLVAALAALATIAAACGGTTTTPGTPSKGTVTVAGINFPENSILANLYHQSLALTGYTANDTLNLTPPKSPSPPPPIPPSHP